MSHPFANYLLAKQTVDDRALNPHVWQAMAQFTQQKTEPFSVLELGTGIGTMLDRLQSWGVWNDRWRVTAVDNNPANIRLAQQRVHLPHVTFQCVDLFDFLAQTDQTWDLIIAHAFLDLFDLSTLIPQLTNRLSPNGAVYFSINFDGETIFLPEHPHDAEILSAYHQSMHGGQHLGRYLVPLLPQNGVHIKAVGSSDWIVHAQEGQYLANEADFLRHILGFFEQSVPISPERTVWLNARYNQIEQGQMVYIAHQLDVFGQHK